MIDAIRDWWRRWFGTTYIVEEETPSGGTPKQHDFRHCPHCGVLQFTVHAANARCCGNCKIPLLTDNEHGRGVYIKPSRSGRSTHVFRLEKPLHNPFIGRVVLGVVGVTLVFYATHQLHPGMELVAADMSASAWLQGEHYKSGLVSQAIVVLLITLAWFVWFVLKTTTQTKDVPEIMRTNEGQQLQQKMLNGLTLLLGMVASCFLLVVADLLNPLTRWSDVVAVEQHALYEYLEPRLESEVAQLVSTHRYVDALQLLQKANAKWPEATVELQRRAKFTAADALGHSALYFDNPLVRESLKAPPELMATYYLDYLSVAAYEEQNKHCLHDPFNLVTPANGTAYEELVRFCESRLKPVTYSHMFFN